MYCLCIVNSVIIAQICVISFPSLFKLSYESATMSYVSDLSQSQEYLSFRSSVPLRRIVVDSDNSKVCNGKVNMKNLECNF